MQWNSEQENLLKRYLLGEASAQEQQQVEESLLRSDDVAERLVLIEEELIDDYARGALTQQEREQFEQYFLATPKRRKKLETAQALVAHANRNNNTAEITTAVETEAPRKQEIEVGVVQVRPEARPVNHWWRGLFEPRWKVAALATLVLAAGLGIWRVFFYESPVEQGLIALAGAYQEQRPLEARITGFAYAPFAANRGPNDSRVNEQGLDEAEVLLRKTARERPDAAGLRGLGLLYLARKDFAKAIAQFEQALKMEPRNARLHGELGAALLEKSRFSNQRNDSQQSALEISRALEELNQALQLDNSLLEALFNRALCRQAMGLDNQAIAGWQEYLQKDSSSPWAEEARGNLRQIEEKRNKVSQLKQSLFDRFVTACAEHDEEKAWLYFQYARSRNGNSITAKLIDNLLDDAEPNIAVKVQAPLQMLSYAGELEVRKAGDYFTHDLANYHRNLQPAQKSILVRARQAIKDAAADYSSRQPKLETALAGFLKASDLFASAGNIGEARLSESRASYCRNRLLEVDEAIRSFQELIRFYRAQRYNSLMADAWSGLADAYTGADDFSNSVHAARMASQTARECHYSFCELRSEGTLASVYRELGRFDDSLAAGLLGIRLASQLPVETREIWGFYSLIPMNLFQLDWNLSALDVQLETKQLAMKSGWPLYQSLSYARLGLINAKLGRYEEAINDGNLSLEKARLMDGQKSRDNAVSDALFYQGEMLRQADHPDKALDSYRQALESYAQTPFRLFAYKALQGSFLVNLALQDKISAAEDLKQANHLLEIFRGHIIEESSRNAFFSNSQEFFDAAIEFELEQNHSVAQAFQLSEHSRARSLLEARQTRAHVVKSASGVDLQLSANARPLNLNEIQHRLDADTLIIEYAVLKDKVVAWIITSRNCFLVSKDINADLLKEKIESFVQLISAPSVITKEAKRRAAELHEIILKPIAPYLENNHLICIVPDKSLNYVPFASLVSPDTGKFFIEDHNFIIAPGATAFIFCAESDRLRKQGNQREKLLCIGNPQIAQRYRQDLQELLAARDEAESIATLYPTSVLLVGDQAHEAIFKKQAATADVIHIASHTLVDERAPLLSKLLLTPDSQAGISVEDADGELHAYELYQLKFLRARLVVLSACQTGWGRNYNGEGVINLARPFISAGVPIVVASLWNVRSEKTAELMKAFHRARKEQSLRTPEALCAAQRKLLKQEKEAERASFTWAAFTAIGGVS